MIARRAVLAGLGATAATPTLARSNADDDARDALDTAAKLPPDEALAALAHVEDRSLSPNRRLDLQTARAGLAIDAALAGRPNDYTLRLRRQLGTGDPYAARARIDRALADLHASAARLFDRIGIREPTIGARYTRLFRDERHLYAHPDQALAEMRRTLAADRAHAQREVPGTPPFCLDVTVGTLSPQEIAAGRQGYREVPAPGRPGTYIVDLKDLRRRPSWTLPSVVAHELLPGHMIQLGIEGWAPPHPLRLTYAATFVEGWATYAETLIPYPDPRAMLGHLHWLIFRAARARVDIGIHRERWSLDRARAWLTDKQGEAVYFAPFDTDLARIAKEPATRLAEALAWLAIANRAPRNLSARRAWHRAVLANGRRRLEDLP